MSYPYLEYVKALSKDWTSLQVLVDFVDPEIRFGNQTARSIAQRMEKVNITVVDINQAGEQQRYWSSSNLHLTSEEDLEAWKMGALASTESSGPMNQILMVEDLSRSVIEFLGHNFALDPRFFQNHLRDIDSFGGSNLYLAWNRQTKSPVSNWNFDQWTGNLPFVNLQYCRPYPFKGWPETNHRRLETNVPRISYRLGRDIFLSEVLSVYSDLNGINGKNYTIVIFDAPLDPNAPHTVHLPNSGPIPRYKIGQSNYDRFLTDLPKDQNLSPREGFWKSFRFTVHEIPVCWSLRHTLQGDILRLAIHSALGLHESLVPALERHPLRYTEEFHTSENIYALNSDLNIDQVHDVIHRARRCLTVARTRLEGLQSAADKHLDDYRGKKLYLDGIRQVLQQFDSLRAEMETQLIFISQAKAGQEMESMLRLSKLAFLFIPFSTVSGVLGIPDVQRYWVFTALVAPLLVIIFMIVIKGMGIREVLRSLIRYLRHDLRLICTQSMATVWPSRRRNTQLV